MNQQTLFTKNTIKHIHIYHEAAKQESVGGDGSITVQFTPTQKKAIQAIMKEHNLKASTFIREMVDTYIEIFPFKDKIREHGDILQSLLQRLS